MNQTNLAIGSQWAASSLEIRDRGIVRTAHADDGSQISMIVEFMQRLVRSNDLPFVYETDSAGLVHGVVRNRPLVRRLSLCLACNIEALRAGLDRHSLHPLLALFLDAASAVCVRDLLAGDADKSNEWVTALRANAKSEGIQKRVRNFERAAYAGVESVGRYLRWLRDSFDGIQWLRLELRYLPGRRSDLTLKDAKGALDKLAALLLSIPTRSGQIMKLQHDVAKSYHVQLLVFFSSNERRSEIEMVRLIGDIWCKRASGGDGEFAHLRRLSAFSGHHRPDPWGDLERDALFLARMSYFKVLQRPGAGKTLRMGEKKIPAQHYDYSSF